MTTTISPSIGHPILFTQQGVGTTPGYDMVDLRRAIGVGHQEGVMDTHSYEATQRGAGANMSVDIAASTADASGSGVAAIVQGDSAGLQGLYPIAAHSAVINETITAAHATLPRVDAVILEIQDNLHDSSGGNLARTRVVAGTATAGATLDNARDGSHGGAAIPSNALHLADVLVGAAVSSITNSVIRDRRKWARGANADVSLVGSLSISITTLTLIDSANLNPRVECSGAPVVVEFFSASWSNDASRTTVFDVFQDGATLTSGAGVATFTEPAAGGVIVSPYFRYAFTPSAGSHKIGPAWKSTFGGALSVAGSPTRFTVREVIRQNTANNPTTTG